MLCVHVHGLIHTLMAPLRKSAAHILNKSALFSLANFVFQSIHLSALLICHRDSRRRQRSPRPCRRPRPQSGRSLYKVCFIQFAVYVHSCICAESANSSGVTAPARFRSHSKSSRHSLRGHVSSHSRPLSSGRRRPRTRRHASLSRI